jgi:hypothetical protein
MNNEEQRLNKKKTPRPLAGQLVKALQVNSPLACFSRIFAASSSFLRWNAVPDSVLADFYSERDDD